MSTVGPFQVDIPRPRPSGSCPSGLPVRWTPGPSRWTLPALSSRAFWDVSNTTVEPPKNCSSGSPEALLPRGPLGTGRATFTASGSSRPDGLMPRTPYVGIDCEAVKPVALRSVHHGVAVASNVSIGSGVVVIVTSRVHLATSAPFRVRAAAPIRPVRHGDGGRSVFCHGSCRLSATGIRFLAILFPPGDWASLAVG